MDIFRLYESTMVDIQPGHSNTKDLRRDQMLNNYDEAVETLENLIRAKENEIAYRRDLIKMLEKSKFVYDTKLKQAKQAYLEAKKHAPDTPEYRELNVKRSDSSLSTTNTTSNNMFASTTPNPPEHAASRPLSISPSTTPMSMVTDLMAAPMVPGLQTMQQSPYKSDLDIPLPNESVENRTSLDRRLSEFLKTFPNLTQAGLTAPNNNTVAPMPGYYTQQQPQPPPPQAQSMTLAPPQMPISVAPPPMMAMMQFPPPPIVTANNGGSTGGSSSSSSRSSSHRRAGPGGSSSSSSSGGSGRHRQNHYR